MRPLATRGSFLAGATSLGVSAAAVPSRVRSAQVVVRLVEASGTTDTATLVHAFENHRYDAAKAQPAFFRACDHQAVQETYCAEMLPRAKRRDPNEYFRIVSAVGGEFAAGTCSDPDSAKAAAIIGAETVPARAGYEPIRIR